MIEREHTVRVWGTPHKVTVYQKSKTVWIAVGEYRGERIEVKSQSQGSALKLWSETARYMGN